MEGVGFDLSRPTAAFHASDGNITGVKNSRTEIASHFYAPWDCSISLFLIKGEEQSPRLNKETVV